MKQITLMIDEELLATIDIQEQKKGISRADYIRMAIIEKLRRGTEVERS